MILNKSWGQVGEQAPRPPGSDWLWHFEVRSCQGVVWTAIRVLPVRPKNVFALIYLSVVLWSKNVHRPWLLCMDTDNWIFPNISWTTLSEVRTSGLKDSFCAGVRIAIFGQINLPHHKIWSPSNSNRFFFQLIPWNCAVFRIRYLALFLHCRNRERIVELCSNCPVLKTMDLNWTGPSPPDIPLWLFPKNVNRNWILSVKEKSPEKNVSSQAWIQDFGQGGPV